MPREQNPTVQIPRERLDQLREVAAALGGVTMSATVGHLVRLAQSDGLVPAHIPGIRVEAEDGDVLVQLGDNLALVYPPALALDLGDALRAFTRAGTDRTGVLNLELQVVIERRGNGVKIRLPRDAREETTLSVDLALELADLIEETAQSLIPDAGKGEGWARQRSTRGKL